MADAMARKFDCLLVWKLDRFGRSLIRERTQAGRLRYDQDYKAGRVGTTVYSRSGKKLPIGGPKKIFNRDKVMEMRQRGASIRQTAKQLGVGVGTISRVLELQDANQ